MKRKLMIILLMICMSMALASNTNAVTSQNFEWAIEPGNRFDFIFAYEISIYGQDQDNESVFLNVTDIDTLDDSITDFWGIANVSWGGYWSNGTSMGLSMGFLYYAPKIAVPIGNWELLSQLAENITMIDDRPTEVEITVNDSYRWGMSYTLNISDSQLEVDAIYSKKDGFLVRLDILVYEEYYSSYTGGFWFYRDGVPPEINHPVDITFNEGETGYRIEWNGTDLNPSAYEIYMTDLTNTYIVTMGLWNSSSEIISYSLDGLVYGNYTFTIILHEASGLSTFDSVNIVVLDDVFPTLSHPDDVTYILGQLGNNITWIMEDTNPAEFFVYEDGVLIGSGDWRDSIASISINVDNLPIGLYTYNITIVDAAGNSATDVVTVTVNPDFLTAYGPLIISVTGVCGLVVTGVYLYKRKPEN